MSQISRAKHPYFARSASQGSGNVWLGSTYGVVVSWSDTQVVAAVASGSKSGTAQILQGGVWSNSVNLTVSTPNIISVTPTTAVAGTQITIAGTGFGASQGSGNVWLGSAYGVVLSWSDTQVVATVALGSKSGTAQVLHGGVWSNSVNLTVSTPNITSVTPTSATAGTQITITGTGFGASQGSGNVWLGSTYGVVLSWSDTQVVANVASGSKSGTAQVLQGGVWSNSINLTVATPNITNVAPTTAAAGAQVTITGTGFGASQGSGNIWLGSTYGVVMSWSDTEIVATVAANSTTGTAQVLQGGVWSNSIAFTISIPTSTPVISSISPSTGGIGTAVTITGSYFGSTQGQSVVTFNGISARISNWSDTSIIAKAPSGLTAGPATVIVAVSQLSSNGVQYTVTQPLFVTPNQATLAVGQTRSMQLIDENGVLLSNTTWSFDDNTIAEIIPPANPGDPTVLQADAVGSTNFIAAYGNRTGTAKITVLPAGAPFPIGTVQWSVPPLGSFGISKTVQSLSIDENTPDLYTEDDGVYGGNGSIRALTADGQQKWIWPSTNQDKFPVLVAADDQGGAVYFANQDIPNQFGSFCYFGRVDENGSETWQYQETNCSEDYAIAPDGTIFLVEDAFQNTATTVITALDPSTGQVKYTVPLPASSQITTGANSTEGLDPNRPAGLVYCTPGTSGSTVTSTISIHGNISVSSDGNAFIPFTTSTDFADAQPCDSSSDPNDPGYPHLVKPTDGSWSASGTLQLLTIHPDGSHSIQQLDANSASGSGQTVGAQVGFFGMGRAISDGQGGALLTLSSPPALYHASSSGTSKFGLPITPDAPPGDDLYIADSMLLGEDGTAYIVGGSSEEAPVDTVLAVDSNSGNVKWTASPGLHPKLSTVTSDGSVAFQYSLPDFSMHSAFADPTGQVSPLFANPADNSDVGPVIAESFGLHVPSYFASGNWLAFLSAGEVAPVRSGPMAKVPSDKCPRDGCNAQAAHAVPHPKFGIYWCGIGRGLQGYIPNSPCPQGGGHDLQWAYYPQENDQFCPPPSCGAAALKDFNVDHPEWIGVVQSEAINSFRAAYAKYGIQVQFATQTPYCPFVVRCSNDSQPDQDFTVFVLGDSPVPTAGQRFLGTTYSGVYYFYLMEQVQTAFGQPETPNGGGWINYSPTYPPADTSKFLDLLRAMGKGIGNAAAHEIGHQLELITNIKPNGNKGLPFMDCGLGNPGDSNRPVRIPCEGNPNDNFVYGFYIADGFPQDPTNSKSTGGMFFYGVPGTGQPGAPFQPTIHWGPSDILWLQNYSAAPSGQQQ